MKAEDEELIKELIKERNLKSGAYHQFRTPLKKYICSYHKNKHTMQYYIEKARKEQEKGIVIYNRWIYTDLTAFRTYLITEELSSQTIKNYMLRIRTIYRHYNIELPDLKPVKMKMNPPITYDDLPTRDDIRRAVSLADSQMKALILFQSSSGTTLHESTTITVGMFLSACDCKPAGDVNISLELSRLRHEENLVPLFSLERVKTNKFYYTCCSPEAAQAVINWLLRRCDNEETLSSESKVFPLSKSKYTYKYSQLNDMLGLGMVGYYGKFRSHSMRKFHASNLGCGTDLIDELQGRGRSQVHDAYIKDRPDKIREEYLKYMNNILINTVYQRSDGCDEKGLSDMDEVDVVSDRRLSTAVGNGDIQSLTLQVQHLTEKVAVMEYKLDKLLSGK